MSNWVETCPTTWFQGGTDHRRLYWFSQCTILKSISGVLDVFLQNLFTLATQIKSIKKNGIFSKVLRAFRYHPLIKLKKTKIRLLPCQAMNLTIILWFQSTILKNLKLLQFATGINLSSFLKLLGRNQDKT